MGNHIFVFFYIFQINEIIKSIHFTKTNFILFEFSKNKKNCLLILKICL